MTVSLHALGCGSSAGSYYTDDPNREARPRSRDEYYNSGGNGRWWTTGESIVRNGVPIDRQTFRDLCAGLDPRDGSPLVRGAGPEHRAGWDLTFSPPKGFSILWAAGTPRQRQRLEQIQRDAVHEALQFLVRERLVYVRLGAGGQQREVPTDVIVGLFEHFTSREGDPACHVHAVLMNLARAADGKYRTCDTDHYAWQLAIGAAFRSALSAGLRTLGLTFHHTGRDQFEINGVQCLISAFSKRARQIEDTIDRGGSAAQKEIAALATRQNKEDVPTGAELEARWKQEFDAIGIDPWIAVDASAVSIAPLDERTIHDEFEKPEITGNTPVARAASAIFRHEAVLNRRVLLQRSLAEASLGGNGIESVYAEIGALEAAGKLQKLSTGRPERWTTPAIAAAEATMLRATDREQGLWFDDAAISSALSNAPQLSAEQRQAVLHATSGDPITVIQAGAGTGKTTLASVIIRAAEGSQIRIVSLAPSHVAADELTKSTGIKATTIAHWLHGLASGRIEPPSDRTLLLIDEAGMVGTRDMSAILQAAAGWHPAAPKANAKIVLIADSRQLAPVPFATPLRAVADILERRVSLSEVRRQQVEWQRVASTLMARGDAEVGLRAYASRGRVELVAGSEAAQARTVALWRDLRARHGDDVIIVTRRNRDAAAINQLARRVLREEGQIRGDEVEVSTTDHKGVLSSLCLAVGDQIRFGENLPTLGIRNGTRATVLRIDRNDPAQPHVTLKLNNGQSIGVVWSKLVNESRRKPIAAPRVTHSVAGTVYAAQGRTVAAAVLHVQSVTDAREVYVGLTRHLKDATVVVESTRLEAACRARQVDHRMVPTRTAVMERLLAEARRYYDKSNVIDCVEDRKHFIATGEIVLSNRDPRLNIKHAIEAASAQRSVGREFGQPVWDLTKTAAWTMASRSYEKFRNLLQSLIARSRTRAITREPERDPSWAPSP